MNASEKKMAKYNLYGVYGKHETLVCLGTSRECADYLGISVN